MQVFVPSTDLEECVRVLDNKRLGKQRAETLQIVLALLELGMERKLVRNHKGEIQTNSKGQPEQVWSGRFVPKVSKARRNHPATIAWEKNIGGLLRYQYATCTEWTSRTGVTGAKFKDTCANTTYKAIKWAYAEELGVDWNDLDFNQCGLPDLKGPLPTWWGDEKVHSSHRSALLFKDPDWYSQFGWNEAPAYDYVWPVSA